MDTQKYECFLVEEKKHRLLEHLPCGHSREPTHALLMQNIPTKLDGSGISHFVLLIGAFAIIIKLYVAGITQLLFMTGKKIYHA